MRPSRILGTLPSRPQPLTSCGIPRAHRRPLFLLLIDFRRLGILALPSHPPGNAFASGTRTALGAGSSRYPAPPLEVTQSAGGVSTMRSSGASLTSVSWGVPTREIALSGLIFLHYNP
jgi:hypothetical protein